MKGHLDAKELETYRKADLQALARELDVSDAGTIKEIAARCAAVEVDIPDEAEQTAEEKAEAQEAEAEHAAGQPEAPAEGQTRVKVARRYLDKQLNQIKEAGEVFTVDGARADELVAAGVVKIAE